MEICLIHVHLAHLAGGKARPARWRDAAEMSCFSDVARDHPVVLGRRTWESLPGGLPGRQNIVLSSQKIAARGAMHCETLPEALTLASVLKPAKVFLIGGAGLRAKAGAIVDRLFVARLGFDDAQSDTAVPEIDPRRFALIDRVGCRSDDGWRVIVEEYRRLRSMH